MAVVYWSHGVDYVGRREVVRRGYFRGACGAAVQEAAFAKKGGAGGGVDGPVLEGQELLAGFPRLRKRGMMGK